MTGHLTLPDRSSILMVAASLGTWCGVIAGGAGRPWIGAVGAVAASSVALILRRGTVLMVAAALVAGVVAGAGLAARNHASDLPAGRVRLVVEVVADGRAGQWSGSAMVRPIAVGDPPTPWSGPAGRLNGPDAAAWTAGERYLVTTAMRPSESRNAAWIGSVTRAIPLGAGAGPAAIARAMRDRILHHVEPMRSGSRALLAGLLIGDTSAMSTVDVEDMRRAGLSHFVAVSGSNVALFLGAVFVMAGPLGWGSRRRAVLGVSGLVFFVLVVGPDPSVLRAATMAALVLVGRAIGFRPPSWWIFGAALTALLLIAPQLAWSLGFRLSVAATAGVVMWGRRFTGPGPRWVWTLLGATVGAQLAVAPLLLAEFGSVPLWAPVANLLASGLVAIGTVAGGLGAVLGFDPLVEVAAACGGVVLSIAEFFAPFPQLQMGGAMLVAAAGAAAMVGRLRPLVVLGAAAVVAWCSFPMGVATDGPVLVALDVGQGDAILVRGGGGATVLFDTGPAGVAVLDGLRRQGVTEVDLLVITHGDLDHYGGGPAILDDLRIGALWHSGRVSPDGEYAAFLEDAAAVTSVSVPSLGRYRIDDLALEVIAPARRFADRNDEGLVVVVRVAGTSILMAADIEEIAQQALGPVPADILKVPHHGAATSDLDWLAASEATVAVISVGENSFGHPRPEILAALEEAGMVVRRTDLEGDVVIPLGRR